MFVEISFKISGLTLSNKWKGILKIMYTKNIKNPYSIALEIPLSLSFFFVKKLTVNGIIGNTQGVKIITPKEGEKIMECVRIDEEDSEDQ